MSEKIQGSGIGIIAVSSNLGVRCGIFGIFVEVDFGELFMLNEAGDGYGSAGASMIRDEAEGGETESGDCTIELGEAICAVGGSANDYHGAYIVGLRLATDGVLEGALKLLHRAEAAFEDVLLDGC
jgi:hypothetical protein